MQSVSDEHRFPCPTIRTDAADRIAILARPVVWDEEHEEPKNFKERKFKYQERTFGSAGPPRIASRK
jgi:hypothetical protein